MHTFSLHIKTLIFVPFLVLLLACVDESSLMSTSDLVIINNLDEGVETRMNGESDSMMNTPIHMTSNRDASTTDVQIDLGSLTDMTVNQTNRDMDSPSDISINFGLDRELIEDRGVRDAEMHTIMDAELDLDFLTRLDVGQAPDLNTWPPLDLSSVDAYAIPRAAKIFSGQHPNYNTIPNIVATATSNVFIRVAIDVYLINSTLWTQPEQLIPYFELVNQYFNQARIQLTFTFRDNEAPAWESEINQVHLYFTHEMMNPSGSIPDGFGNLPAGKAVINDRLMNRPHVHMNPLFLPGKPIGHEIGHVLGLPHVNARNFLMAQGTSATNQLDLTPEESVIMRIMALHRFGGEVME